MEEIWKPVRGFEDRYQISNMGRLKSFAQDKVYGKIKAGHQEHKGYLVAKLYDGNHGSEHRKVHRIVAEAFLDNPDHLPYINHKDEDKTNNRVDNLEWCTNEYNMNYGTRNERAGLSNRNCPTTSKGVYSEDENGNIEYFPSVGEASRQTGLQHANIVRALKHKCPRCGKRHWFYSDCNE